MEAREGMNPGIIRQKIDKLIIRKLVRRFPNANITVVNPSDIEEIAMTFPEETASKFIEDNFGIKDNWHFSQDGLIALFERYPVLSTL